MTDDEADELLRERAWAKFSDARELLQEVHAQGSAEEHRRIVRWLQDQGYLQAAAQLINQEHRQG